MNIFSCGLLLKIIITELFSAVVDRLAINSFLFCFQVNTTLTKLNLKGNNIGESGMLYLQVMMSENCTITSLVCHLIRHTIKSETDHIN